MILTGMVLSSGCVKQVPPPVWVANVRSLSPPIGPDEIIRFPEGEKVSLPELLTDIEDARVILIGEAHDQFDHHRVQLTVIRELMQTGKSVVIAMEMFQRPQQPVLDRWSEGILTEAQFLKDVDWDTTWAMDYGLYRGLLDEARIHHLKVLALNVPRERVRKVAEAGIEGLSPEEAAQLPKMDLSNRDHRTYINAIYKRHTEGSAKGFERFYEAQCLWDEGMAETLSDFLRSPEGQGKTVVVIAGTGHVVFYFGIPKRFYRRTPLPLKTIVLKEWEKDLAEDQDLTFVSPTRPVADYLWVTRPNPPEKKRPRIGVIFKEGGEQEGLVIERVVPEGPAEKAGLLPGDRLVAVEGKGIQTVRDIQEALEEKGWGDDITFTVDREGSKKEISVTLPRPPE